MAQLPHHKVNLIRFGIIQRSLKLLLMLTMYGAQMK